MAGKVSELKAEVRALVKMRASNKKAAESTKRNGERSERRYLRREQARRPRR